MRRALLFVALASCGHPAPATPQQPTPPDAAPGATAPPVAEPDPTPPALRLPGDVRPTKMALDLTIVPDQKSFSGHVRVDGEVVTPTRVVWMNGTGLTVRAATVGGAAARVVVGGEDFLGLVVPDELPAGPVVIEIDYEASIDRDRSRGLYAEQDGGTWYAYTFFEPIDARRAFPCFDEPSYKIPWTLTFHVRATDVALGNAPIASERPEGRGMKVVTLAESRPLPSYLVAFVVGPFDVVDGGTAGRVSTPIQFVVPRGHAEELAYAKSVTPKVVAALETYFDMDYPYGKLDVAVVPRFWGTMEHPGIVAMGQPLTLIKPDQDGPRRRKAYTNILAHELSHYWFGDVVTLAWWNDTWLNEALAEWVDPIITDAAEPSWSYLDERVDRAEWGMGADEQATHPIRQSVDTRQAIEASFDNGITYAKGSAVLRMFEAYVGEEKWRAFIRVYVKKFAWGNVTADDFIATMQAELGAPVAAAFSSFLDQPGLPAITARCDAGTITLSQTRSLVKGAPDTKAATWSLPVCVRARGEKAACALLDHGDATIAVKRCPRELLVDAGATGYYRVAYTPAQSKALLARGKGWLTVNERRRVVADVTAARRRGEMAAGDLLALIPSIAGDPDDRMAMAAFGLAEPLDPRTLDDEQFARRKKFLRKTFGARATKLGWLRGAKDSDDRQELRLAIVPLAARAGDAKLKAAASELATTWLSTQKGIPDDTLDAVLAVAAADGDAKLFDAVLAAANGASDRRMRARLLGALGTFHDPALAARALAIVAGTDVNLRDSIGILWRLLFTRETNALAWEWIQANLDALLPRMRSDEAAGLIGAVAEAFCDQPHRDAAAALLGPRAEKIDGAANALAQGLVAADQCIALAAQDRDSVAAFLAAWR